MIFLSLPSQGAWIEICCYIKPPYYWQSLPSQGAWIEIIPYIKQTWKNIVAPFTGSVDWNHLNRLHDNIKYVAPFTGSVDWNGKSDPLKDYTIVAPFTGSVDWNITITINTLTINSRSLHRERGLKLSSANVLLVVGCRSLHRERGLKSSIPIISVTFTFVAPFTGSVDWNYHIYSPSLSHICRSLHRERGLKSK